MKPNLIFLHGGPGFKDYLRPFFEDLKDSFHLHFYDQLQGSSVRIDDLISQLDMLVSSLSGSIILAGHSWGGVLAAEYATRFPSKVQSLVLMNTGLCFAHWNDEFIKEKNLLGLTDAPPEFIFLTDEERGNGKEFLEETWKTFSAETFDSIYETYVLHFDLREAVKHLSIPVYVVFSSNDVRFPARVARNLIPDRSGRFYFEISNAGHFPFLMQEGRKCIHDFFRIKLSGLSS